MSPLQLVTIFVFDASSFEIFGGGVFGSYGVPLFRHMKEIHTYSFPVLQAYVDGVRKNSRSLFNDVDAIILSLIHI